MNINNKIKRSLSGEWGGKASKEKESLGAGSRKGESFFLEKGIDNHKKKKTKEKWEIFEVGQKIKNGSYVFPEAVDGEKLHWTLRRETDKIEWFKIKEVIINRLGKPKYICVGSDGKNYAIKQFTWQRPLELLQKDDILH